VGCLFTYAILRLQYFLPLNPQKLAGVSPDLSFNTAASFTTNTNWQNYGGESTMSYFSQMVGLAFHNFVSAAIGIAIAAALGGCETGSAKMTRGYRLKAKHVIHAVGPVWGGGQKSEEELLASCYRTALALAAEQSLSSIAFPAISTGVYRFPPERAARIAVGTVVAEIAHAPRGITRVVFCCFSPDGAGHHKDAFTDLGLA